MFEAGMKLKQTRNFNVIERKELGTSVLRISCKEQEELSI